MERISMTDLERAIGVLNDTLGREHKPYTRTDGKLRANIGNFHLSGAYGGWQLQEMANENGGVRSHTAGYAPKREVYQQVRAMIRGAELAKPAQD